ncbi:MAG: serine/threonine protein kinase [Anaerolineaceae bacterium]|nr:serine/threonine protein kinase [Anaerolineaceae bacterium]
MSQVSWLGQTLGGRYRIEERLGQGGMSAVYKATDPNLRRVVAIKMIHSHLSSNPDFVRRFEEEAAAVAQLRHPNIIQVYDFNHDDETYYMVLEFVPGETLQDRLRRLNDQKRRMPVNEAANYIAQVGDAIQYAHERGMIHRDIKPANIMLDIYGKAILMDFGIAKIVGGQLHTATGAVVGTAMYMSPEQIVGERVDERSDLYSLGVTLFETLSGRPPFEADSAMTLMMMHMNDPAPSIRDLQPEVPNDLALVVEKSLEKKKEARFQTASQMASVLKAIRSRIENPQSTAADGEAFRVDRTVVEEPPDATIIDTPDRAAPIVQTVGNRTISSPQSTQGQRSRGQNTSENRQQPGPGSQIYPPLAGGGQGSPPGGRDAAGMRTTPPPPLSQQGVRQPRRSISLPWIIGGGIGLLGLGTLVLIGIFLIGRNVLFGGSLQATRTPTLNVSSNITATAAAAALLAGIEPSPTELAPPVIQPSATPAPTNTTSLPTQTPLPVFTDTPTIPTDRPYVLIKNITIQNGRYVVEYETYGYTEKLPGMHVHFFFDTVSPENAGMPGSGPWILYGGPRPFTKYAVSDRPAYANKMCALVANPNHSVQKESGNCIDLPG